MVVIFYACFLITLVSSIKAICSFRVDKAILYFCVSTLSIAVIFVYLDAYISFLFWFIIVVGGVTVSFLYIDYFLKIQTDTIENNLRGISPKIWLGPLILTFILIVILLYGIISSDYSQLSSSNDVASVIPLNVYLLIAQLIGFLLLGTLVIVYHFTRGTSEEKTL